MRSAPECTYIYQNLFKSVAVCVNSYNLATLYNIIYILIKLVLNTVL